MISAVRPKLVGVVGSSSSKSCGVKMIHFEFGWFGQIRGGENVKKRKGACVVSAQEGEGRWGYSLCPLMCGVSEQEWGQYS